MVVKRIKLYMIPAIATDWRILKPQLDEVGDLVVMDWLSPKPGEAITSYARRMAAGLDNSAPYIIGGIGGGGMIAQEMAQYLNPVAVVLISTASSTKAIHPFFRMAAKTMQALPEPLVNMQLKLGSYILKLLLPESLRYKQEYVAMLKEFPADLAKWQCCALSKWELKKPINAPILQIHGGRDRIIPVGNVMAKTVIAKGGHFINITHAERVNQFMDQFAHYPINVAGEVMQQVREAAYPPEHVK